MAFVNGAATDDGKRRRGTEDELSRSTFSASSPIGAGAFFFFAGTVGLLRFPDSLTRLHALTKADNLGLGLVVLGLLPRVESLLAALKLVAIWALVLLSGAATRAIDRARPAPPGRRRMSVLQALDIGLALLVLAVAAWTIAAREIFARGGRLCRLWPAAFARLGPAVRARRGA